MLRIRRQNVLPWALRGEGGRARAWTMQVGAGWAGSLRGRGCGCGWAAAWVQCLASERPRGRHQDCRLGRATLLHEDLVLVLGLGLGSWSSWTHLGCGQGPPGVSALGLLGKSSVGIRLPGQKPDFDHRVVRAPPSPLVPWLGTLYLRLPCCSHAASSSGYWEEYLALGRWGTGQDGARQLSRAKSNPVQPSPAQSSPVRRGLQQPAHSTAPATLT